MRREKHHSLGKGTRSLHEEDLRIWISGPQGTQGPSISKFQKLPKSQISGTIQWGNSIDVSRLVILLQVYFARREIIKYTTLYFYISERLLIYKSPNLGGEKSLNLCHFRYCISEFIRQR